MALTLGQSVCTLRVKVLAVMQCTPLTGHPGTKRVQQQKAEQPAWTHQPQCPPRVGPPHAAVCGFSATKWINLAGAKKSQPAPTAAMASLRAAATAPYKLGHGCPAGRVEPGAPAPSGQGPRLLCKHEPSTSVAGPSAGTLLARASSPSTNHFPAS